MHYLVFFRCEVKRLIRNWNSEWSDFSDSFIGKTMYDYLLIIFFVGLLIFMARVMGSVLMGSVNPLSYYFYLIGVTTLLIFMVLMVYNKNIGSYMWRFVSSEVMFMIVWLNMGLCTSIWLNHPFFSWFKAAGIFWVLIFMMVLHSKIEYMRSFIKRFIHIGMMIMYGFTIELILFWDVMPEEFTMDPFQLFWSMIGKSENISPFELIGLYLFSFYLLYLPSEISIKEKKQIF